MSCRQPHAFRKCTKAMLKCDTSSMGYLLLGQNCSFIQLVLYPSLYARGLQLWTIWCPCLMPTTIPKCFPTLLPWLLVPQCMLLVDKEFILRPLFTENNPHLCSGWHAICLRVKNVCSPFHCSLCHLHAALHEGFCSQMSKYACWDILSSWFGLPATQGQCLGGAMGVSWKKLSRVNMFDTLTLKADLYENGLCGY